MGALRIIAWKPNGNTVTPRGPVVLPTGVLVSFETLLMERQVHCETQRYPTVPSAHTLYPFFSTAQTVALNLESAPQFTLCLRSLREKMVPEYPQL